MIYFLKVKNMKIILQDQENAQTSAANPPEMPIVLDEAAIEDILGVSFALTL
jgi:hypothetical protein